MKEQREIINCFDNYSKSQIVNKIITSKRFHFRLKTIRLNYSKDECLFREKQAEFSFSIY